MARLSSKLRSVAFNTQKTRVGVAFWCPGCDSSHAVTVWDDQNTPPVWTWDGNVDAPTIRPSINIKTRRLGIDRICHSLITGGHIQFLPDCTHDLAARTVPLPDWPTTGDEADFYTRPPHD